MSALTFDASSHTYYVDGVPVPRSVTGVLKTAGLIDFSFLPTLVLERHRERGAVVHQAIHYLNERDLDLGEFRADFPDWVGYVDAWVTFCRLRAFVPVLSEHRVYSRRLDCAGTVDCFGLLDGQAVIVDFATGDPADVAKDLQTAGYLILAREWCDEDAALAAFMAAHPVVRRYAVALKVDGTFKLHPYLDPLDARHFLTLVDAQRIVESRRRRPSLESAFA